LSDETVSRIHLEIANRAEGIKVRDLGSTNGTWLDEGVRIAEALVPSGTVIRLGRTQVRIDALSEQVSESLSPLPSFGDLIGVSPAMRSIFALLERVAPTNETVLITGETGTGKEVCAHSIVERSGRATAPLVVVDCGAMPPALLESELFGHKRGAFTGAVSDHQGAFERANGGTVFFDEVGELPLELQTRLLRAVENRWIRRVGGTRKIPLDIRIIAATNRCLEEEVNRGAFRADLYYRLSVVQVRLPPLRERPQDIGPLATNILLESGASEQFNLDDETLARLQRYSWPGNVRELRNYLRRLTLGEREAPGAQPAAVAETGQTIDLSVSFREAKEAAVARFERAYLTALMRSASGNVSQAARMAQTDRTHLSRLLNKYGLNR
jgi:transcriptional regulator with GAF, ATPase, and Fis domain